MRQQSLIIKSFFSISSILQAVYARNLNSETNQLHQNLFNLRKTVDENSQLIDFANVGLLPKRRSAKSQFGGPFDSYDSQTDTDSPKSFLPNHLADIEEIKKSQMKAKLAANSRYKSKMAQTGSDETIAKEELEAEIDEIKAEISADKGEDTTADVDVPIPTPTEQSKRDLTHPQLSPQPTTKVKVLLAEESLKDSYEDDMIPAIIVADSKNNEKEPLQRMTILLTHNIGGADGKSPVEIAREIGQIDVEKEDIENENYDDGSLFEGKSSTQGSSSSGFSDNNNVSTQNTDSDDDYNYEFDTQSIKPNSSTALELGVRHKINPFPSFSSPSSNEKLEKNAKQTVEKEIQGQGTQSREQQNRVQASINTSSEKTNSVAASTDDINSKQTLQRDDSTSNTNSNNGNILNTIKNSQTKEDLNKSNENQNYQIPHTQNQIQQAEQNTQDLKQETGDKLGEILNENSISQGVVTSSTIVEQRESEIASTNSTIEIVSNSEGKNDNNNSTLNTSDEIESETEEEATTPKIIPEILSDTNSTQKSEQTIKSGSVTLNQTISSLDNDKSVESEIDTPAPKLNTDNRQPKEKIDIHDQAINFSRDQNLSPEVVNQKASKKGLLNDNMFIAIIILLSTLLSTLAISYVCYRWRKSDEGSYTVGEKA